MAQRLINVRVRPPRVAILINRDGTEADVLLAFEFFSKIWGGRFGQILPVNPKTSDPLSEFRLAESRPEFVYGIGMDDDHWGPVARQSCQPRGYGKLEPEFVKRIKEHHFEEFILVDHALIHLSRTWEQNKAHKQALRLVSPANGSPFTTYCAANFGIHHQNLRKDLFDLETAFAGASTADYIQIVTEFAKEWQQSWLDVTGHELNPRIIGPGWGWGQLPPTIVLVGNPAMDLALFWNLRTASYTTYPSWIIPIPASGANDADAMGKLKDWLLAFLPYGPRSNFCVVTSQSVDESVCRSFSENLQTALTGTAIEVVDYEPPLHRLPVVIPYEHETTWPVDLVGQKLTIIPPRPKAFANLDSSRAWIVDLLKDVKTGRAVKELQIPPNPVVFELLNGPCPPSFERTRIPRSGDGTESINLRCSGSKEVVKVYLPTGEEILEEILREHGIEPLPDEKRSSYLPVIKRFGGLYFAAAAFAGQSGSILNALTKGTKTPKEIQGTCRLAKGELTGQTYIQRVELSLQRESERMKRVSRQRFLEYAKQSQPENLKLRSLLEYWADRRVLSRHWKIGPCRRCNQKYFVPSMNIQRRVVCTNCGHRISLPPTVPIGYALQRPVAHAIQEGIIPVAQTGQFLRGMTDQGFFWLPGVKYKIGDKPGDIDLLACCDGHIVICECKCIEDTPAGTKVWDEVVAQFLETTRIAKLCKASLVALASRASEYPQQVIDRLTAELGTSIPYLLLSKDDLEKGHRPVKDGTFTRHLAFYDLLPKPFPEKLRDRSGKPRTINMGWGVYTR